jgi:hypothetical protein
VVVVVVVVAVVLAVVVVVVVLFVEYASLQILAVYNTTRLIQFISATCSPLNLDFLTLSSFPQISTCIKISQDDIYSWSI